MKRVVAAVFAVCLLVPGFAAGEEKKELKEGTEKRSYSMGADLGSKLKKMDVEIDQALFMKGMQDGMSGGSLLLTEKEIQETLMGFQRELVAKQAEKMKEVAEKNKKDGEAFLAENKKKEGITTLPSGLQYKVLTEGKGKQPKATDTVVVHYQGTLIDGSEFDSSYRRGEPATFPVNGVIKGWQEALQLMKEGSKFHVVIPAELAYGERGAGQIIGPNSVLIFDMELIEVKPEEGKPAPKETPRAAPKKK